MTYAPTPTLTVAKLYEKTSKNGTQYFVGRWGACRVLVKVNHDRKGDDDPTHLLCLTEAPPYDPDKISGTGGMTRERPSGNDGPPANRWDAAPESAPAPAPAPARTAPPRSWSGPRQPYRAGQHGGPKQRIPDDPIPWT